MPSDPIAGEPKEGAYEGRQFNEIDRQLKTFFTQGNEKMSGGKFGEESQLSEIGLNENVLVYSLINDRYFMPLQMTKMLDYQYGTCHTYRMNEKLEKLLKVADWFLKGL
ncbi:hypothetical protein Btru_010868, partial [Bulinus truncatus]